MARVNRTVGSVIVGLFLLSLVALVVRHIWWPGGSGRYVLTFKALGTDARLEVEAPNVETAKTMFLAARRRLDEVNLMLSVYTPDSEVSTLNRQGAAQVSEGTLAVLRKADEVARLSGGAFDVTYGPLRTLWRRAQSQGEPPTEEAIQKARAAVGYDKLKMAGREVRLSAPGMEVDTGGIAKGYAIDQAAQALRAAGAAAGIVDVGGDLCMFGLPAGKAAWGVAVSVPPGLTQKVLIHVPPCGVATTADYVNGFRVAGKLLSHVIDPRTGRPVEDMASATVVAPDAMTADALAVAVTVMGWPKGMELIESQPDVECLMVVRKADGALELHQSKGFGKLMEKG